MGRLRPREGQWLAQDTQQRQNQTILGLWPGVRLDYKQSPKLGFCFTGQVLIKSAILKPGLLILGCVQLLQRSLQHSQ